MSPQKGKNGVFALNLEIENSKNLNKDLPQMQEERVSQKTIKIHL